MRSIVERWLNFSRHNRGIRGRLPRAVRLGLIYAIAVLAASPLAASAQNQPTLIPVDPDRPYSHSRYLVGISAIAAVATSKDLDPSPGIQLQIGGRFHRYLGAEMFGEWHSRFDSDFRHYSAWGAGMAFRGFFMTGRIQPFVLAGGGVIQTRRGGGGSTVSDIGFAPRAGLGIDYYLNREIAMRLDTTYVIPVGDPAGLDFISVTWGLQWY